MQTKTVFVIELMKSALYSAIECLEDDAVTNWLTSNYSSDRWSSSRLGYQQPLNMARIRIHKPDLWVSANQAWWNQVSAKFCVTGKMLTIQTAEELEIGGITGATDAAAVMCSTSQQLFLRP